MNGIYRNGLINKAQTFGGFKVDPFMVQRIDVLKGPASALFGSNDAAGVVNIITKRPVFEPFAEARLFYGSYDTVELGLDMGGTNAFMPVADQDYDSAFATLPDAFLSWQHPWNKFDTDQASIG